jgi:DNA-directed RNA polymerase specialized sigma24 family protein
LAADIASGGFPPVVRGVAMTPERQPWSLTRDALAALLRFLDDDPERAAVEYESIRLRLTKLFRWRGCSSAEDYTDATVDRVARLLGDGVPVQASTPFALFHGVANNLLREHWRQVERERLAFDQVRHGSQSSESVEEQLAREQAVRADEERRRCLRRCLMRLSAGNRALITRYYASGPVLDKNQRKAVAAELHITVNALRVRAHRVRTEVGDCIGACLQRRSA